MLRERRKRKEKEIISCNCRKTSIRRKVTGKYKQIKWNK
jgi:hypothetical protein